MREPFSFNSFYLVVLRKITNSVTKMTNFPHGGISKIFFFTICTWPNRPVGAKILSGFQLEGKTDVWISQVRCVKGIILFKIQSWFKLLNIWYVKFSIFWFVVPTFCLHTYHPDLWRGYIRMQVKTYFSESS